MDYISSITYNIKKSILYFLFFLFYIQKKKGLFLYFFLQIQYFRFYKSLINLFLIYPFLRNKALFSYSLFHIRFRIYSRFRFDGCFRINNCFRKLISDDHVIWLYNMLILNWMLLKRYIYYIILIEIKQYSY